MTKKPSPRVLTIDDGEPFIRRSNTSAYGFVFSSNVKDWYESKPKQLKRFIQRMKDEGR